MRVTLDVRPSHTGRQICIIGKIMYLIGARVWNENVLGVRVVTIRNIKIGSKGRRTLYPKRANDILPKSVEE